MVNKKSDGGSQVKESTDSNATLEEEDVRGNLKYFISLIYSSCWSKQFCFCLFIAMKSLSVFTFVFI